MADEKKKKEKKQLVKDVKSELKKVTWLTPKQLAKNTAAVIVLVLIVAFIIFVLDRIFLFASEQGVEKLKGFVQSNQTTEVEGTNTSTDTTIENAIEDAGAESTTTEETTEGDTESTETEESTQTE